jgi:catechol 2,3-dioxygenase-like lactoylglutathione lyase family enzyme
MLHRVDIQFRGGCMSVQRIGFVGFRSQDLAALRRVFEEGLGMSPTDARADQVRYSLADGTRLEGYSEDNEFHRFFTSGAVVGFAVEDFEESWAGLTRIGIEGLTEIQQEDGQKWVHFRLPDGTIAELIGGIRTATG